MDISLGNNVLDLDIKIKDKTKQKQTRGISSA